MPKIVDYEKKKCEIIEKAMNVFMQHGYYTTNLSGIAQECGMGRTTLYKYFKNKEEIFLGVVQYILEILEKDYKKILEKQGLSFLDKIKLIFSTLVSHSYREKNKMMMLSELSLILQRHGTNKAQEIQRQFSNGLISKFKFLLQEGIKSKELKDIDTEIMACTLFALVKSMVFHPSLFYHINIEDYLQNINLLIDGLKA